MLRFDSAKLTQPASEAAIPSAVALPSTLLLRIPAEACLRFLRARLPVISAVLLAGAGSPGPVSANPAGARVTAGSASIKGSGSTLTIEQSSRRAIIEWDGFSIGTSEETRFLQPGKDAAILNRVTGALASRLDGRLTANGNVYLINPNGILVGAGGVIDTNSFIGSTLDVSDAAFLRGGDLTFSGTSTAGVTNHGTITGAAGDVVLIAREVTNNGTISAPRGTAALAAGSEVLLKKVGEERITVRAGSGSVVNAGTIAATSAELKAAGGNLYALAINNSGVVRATTVQRQGGRILLKAGAGTLQNSGTLDARGLAPKAKGGAIKATAPQVAFRTGSITDASGPAGGGVVNVGGGFHGKDPHLANATSTIVEAGATIRADATTSGDGGQVVLWADDSTTFAGQISARGSGATGRGGEVEVSGRAQLHYSGATDLLAAHGATGNLLLDPYNVTISTAADTGAGFTASADDTVINTTTLQNALGLANVTVSTGSSGTQAGDITVANAVTWASGNQLTLNAANNIAVNAPLSATSGGGIQLTAGNNVTLSSSLSVGAGAGSGVVLQAGDTVYGNTGSSITTQGQAITLNSDRDASGAGPIYLTAMSVTSNGGDITLGGGANPATTAAYGTATYPQAVFVGTGVTVSSGAGRITANGIGVSASGRSTGVAVWGTVQSTSGNITLTGTGGTSSDDYSLGVDVNSGGVVQSTTSGNMTIGGTGGTHGPSRYSVGVICDNASTLSVNSGALSITANAAASGTTRYGMTQLIGGIVRSTGAGNIGITVGGAPTSAYSTSGSFAVGSATMTGNITITSDGFDIGASGTIRGTGALTIQPATASATIGLGNSASGTLNLDATELATIQNGFSNITIGSATGTGAVDIRTASFTDPVTIRTPAGAGSITLNGDLSTGSGTAAGSITLQAGDSIIVSNSIDTTPSIITQGQAIVLNSDRDASGVGRITVTNATINSNNGDITFGGGTNPATTAATGAAGITGIFLAGSSISAGSGAISLTGTGGASGGNSIGVDVRLGSSVSTTTGAINITGVATSTGSNSQGFSSGNGTVSSAGGAINISATSAGTNHGWFGWGSAQVLNSGAGTITITAATGAGGVAFQAQSFSNRIGNSTPSNLTGSITLNADSMVFGGMTIGGSGSLTLQPTTASTTIGLGASASGTLNLDASELATIQDGFSSITIGSSTGTGAIDVRSWTAADPVVIRSPAGAGSITLNGALSTGSGTSSGSITLQAGDSIVGNTGGSITTQGQAITLNSDRDASALGPIYLLDTNITSNGGAITLGGGANPLTDSAYGNSALSIHSSTSYHGIRLANTVISAGAGDVSIRGIGATTGSNTRGVNLTSASSVSTTTGAILLVGTGRGSGGANFGISVSGGSAISSASGNIAAIGDSTSTGTDSGGLKIWNTGGASTISTGGGGTITLTGIGSTNGGAGTNRFGVSLDAATVSAVNGAITINGTGGNAAGTQGAGLQIEGNTSVRTTGTGDINITATSNSTGTNAGGLAFSNVAVTGASEIRVADGNLTINATSTAAGQPGIRFGSGQAGRFESTGSGAITITATGGSGANDIDLTGAAGSVIGEGPSTGTASGAITINADTLNINSNTAIQSTGALVIQPRSAGTTIGLGASASGTLNLDATELATIQNGFTSITIGSATGTGAIDVRSWTAADPVVIRSPAGAGSITLNGALSTGSGTSSGSVTLTAAGALTGAAGSSITTQNQAINLTGAPVSGAMDIVSNGGLVTVNQTGSGTMSGVISGSGGLTKNGTGTLTLSNTNTYSGATAVNAGTVALSGFLSNTTSLAIAAGANLNLVGTGSWNRINFSGTSWTIAGTLDNQQTGTTVAQTLPASVTLNGGTITATGGATSDVWGHFAISQASVVTVTGTSVMNGSFRGGTAITLSPTTSSDTLQFTGTLGNNGTLSLVKSGSGTAVLSGANTYSGTTDVSAGTLAAASTSAFGSLSAVTVASGATLDLRGFSNTIGSLAGAGTVTNSAASLATLTTGGDNTSTTFSGIIQNGAGTTAFTKAGTGTLTLSNYNTYTGGTTVDAGTLSLSKTGPGPIGNIVGTLTIDSGGTVNADTTNWNLGYNGGQRVDDIVINGGTLNFAGANANGGFAGSSITLNGGSITGSEFDWYSGGTLAGVMNVTGSATTVGINMRSAAAPGSVTLNVSGGQTLTISGPIINTSNANGLVKTGAGTAILQGANAYTGATTVNAGTLQIGNGGTTGTLGTGAVTNGGSLVFNRSNNFTVANDIAGTGSITQTGSGVLTFTGANTYSGATNVSAGTLTLSGSWNRSGATASVAVAAGATLNGTGVVTASTLSAVGLGTVNLTGNNVVDTLAGSGTIGSLTFFNNAPLTVNGITANGAITLQTAPTFDTTLTQPIISSAAGDAIVIASGDDFLNNAGASAIATSNGRFLIYSSDWAEDVSGGLAAGRLYNRTFAANSPAAITQPGSHFIYGRQPTLALTALDASRDYGDVNPTFGVLISGLVNGDSAAGAYSGSPTATTLATQTSGIGTYAITAGLGTLTLTDQGYAMAFVPGTLTINRALLTVTADDKVREYGDPNPTLTAVVTGFKNSEDASVIAGLALSTPATQSTGIGNYAINASGANASNYSFAYNPGTLTIDPAPLLIRADDKVKVFGAANPAFTASFSGFKNGEDASVLSGLAFATTATPASLNGTYPITPIGASAANYAITFQDGTLTVANAILRIMAENKARLYGRENPEFTVTYSGFVNGDDASVVQNLVLGTTATTQSNVGQYAIQILGGTAAGYALDLVPGLLTIEKAPLLIRVSDLERLYGRPNPEFRARFDGLATFDTPSALGTVRYTTAANSDSAPGDYAIRAGGLASGNYEITYDFGTLTVLPLPDASSVSPPSTPAPDFGDFRSTFTALDTALQDLPNREEMIESGHPGPIGAAEMRLRKMSVPGGDFYFRQAGNHRFHFRTASGRIGRTLGASSSFDLSRPESHRDQD